MSVVDELRARPTFGVRLSAGLRRGLVLGTAATLGIGLLAGVGPGAQAPAQGASAGAGLRPAAGSPASQPLRAFSLNIRFSMGPARARADMERALTTLDASVGGFQEISQRVDRDSLHALLRQHNWGWYQPRGLPTPVVFDRDRFRLAGPNAGRTVKVHGAQAGVTPSRHITIVRLREISTGRIFGVINTHTICCASRDAQASNMQRIPRLRKHLAMLRDEMVALGEDTQQVVAMGDLNVNYLADRRRQVAGLPTDAFGDVVNFDMPLVGSRGKRSLLDYVMSLQGGNLERSSGRIVRGFNSDHQAVVVDYSVLGASPQPQEPTEPEKPPAPVFTTGPVTNHPGDDTASRAVLDEWSRAVASARRGTEVLVATPRLADYRVTEALREAVARGVHVRVVVRGGARTKQERRLADAIEGGSASGGSWLTAARRDSLASFLLVEDAAGTRGLTLSTSVPATARAVRSLADTYVTTDGPTYDAFKRTFQALHTGEAVPSSRVTAGEEGLSVQFGPVAAQAPDPVAAAVRPVRCTGATSQRTRRGVSQIRLAVGTWQGRRGIARARQLSRKARWGCTVHVLAGPRVGYRVLRVLRRHRVRVRRANVSQTLLLVEGRYWRNGDVQRTWAGTDALNTRGLHRVSQTVQSTSADTLTAYRQQFVRSWRASR